MFKFRHYLMQSTVIMLCQKTAETTKSLRGSLNPCGTSTTLTRLYPTPGQAPRLQKKMLSLRFWQRKCQAADMSAICVWQQQKGEGGEEGVREGVGERKQQLD